MPEKIHGRIPRLHAKFRSCRARFHFASEAVIFYFGSINSFIGGAKAISVNCLAKQLSQNPMQGPPELSGAGWSHYFWLHLHIFFVRAWFKGLFGWSRSVSPRLVQNSSKHLSGAGGEVVPNRTLTRHKSISKSAPNKRYKNTWFLGGWKNIAKKTHLYLVSKTFDNRPCLRMELYI